MPVPARRRSCLAGALVALLVAPLLPAAPALAAGEATPPPPRSVEDFCQQVPPTYAPFTDTADNTFADNIRCLAAAAITQGGPADLPDDAYGPGLPVRRDAMASFIARLIDTADALDTGRLVRALPPYDGEVDPTDVPAGSVHAQSIDRLGEVGIVSGGPGGRPADEYGPSLEVSRAQMASFIRNALQFMTGEPLVSDQDFFTDDAGAVPHEPRINAVAALGIAVGDGADSYSPTRTVSRDQMSGFLTRALAALEAAGAISPLPFEEPLAETAVTEAPDLVAAELAEGGAGATVLLRFDEDVVADSVEPRSFSVYAFDGEQVTADAATRDEQDPRTVRASFPLDAEQAQRLTVATADAGAVTDADGSASPTGDAPLGDGVTPPVERTSAPDLLRVEDVRPAGPGTTRADLVFDQPAHVVDPAQGQVQLVLVDGSALAGTFAQDADGAPAGNGTDRLPVELDGTATADEVARAVVLQGTVSSEQQQDGGLPLPLPLPGGEDTVEGDVNPLQATDDRRDSVLPDLVSADVDAEAGTVTYVFDEDVVVADGAAFRAYDGSGAEVSGTSAAQAGATVTVTFAAGALDGAVGASAREGAVRSAGEGAQPGQEDEVSLLRAFVAPGTTLAPDLLGATRSAAEGSVTVRFAFDAAVGDPSGEFFVVEETGEQTALEDCAVPADEGDEQVVECVVAEQDDPLTPTFDESAGYAAAQAAVLAAVDGGAVTGADGRSNPEGAVLLR